jgi:hypothetical protein
MQSTCARAFAHIEEMEVETRLERPLVQVENDAVERCPLRLPQREAESQLERVQAQQQSGVMVALLLSLLRWVVVWGASFVEAALVRSEQRGSETRTRGGR